MNSPLGGGGQANLLQYYMGAGGSAETHKLYYVIYEQPLGWIWVRRISLGDLRYSHPYGANDNKLTIGGFHAINLRMSGFHGSSTGR